jgi:hypothetical protein
MTRGAFIAALPAAQRVYLDMNRALRARLKECGESAGSDISGAGSELGHDVGGTAARLNDDVEPFLGEHALLDSEIGHGLVAGRQPIDQEGDFFSSERWRAGTESDGQ